MDIRFGFLRSQRYVFFSIFSNDEYNTYFLREGRQAAPWRAAPANAMKRGCAPSADSARKARKEGEEVSAHGSAGQSAGGSSARILPRPVEHDARESSLGRGGRIPKRGEEKGHQPGAGIPAHARGSVVRGRKGKVEGSYQTFRAKVAHATRGRGRKKGRAKVSCAMVGNPQPPQPRLTICTATRTRDDTVTDEKNA